MITDLQIRDGDAAGFWQPLSLPEAEAAGCRAGILRLDRIDPDISGNKWFKLVFNINAAREEGCAGVVTFGGAWSNHLAATAEAAARSGLKAVGVVRGQDAEARPSETLRRCAGAGMELVFISREEYRQKDTPAFLDRIRGQYPRHYIIPEGGANKAGRDGAGLIARYIPGDCSHVCVSVGTGTTFAGLRNELPAHVVMQGFVPMKGGTYLEPQIAGWLREGQDQSWTLTDRFHGGGFGRLTEAYEQFMLRFRAAHEVGLDRVYTGKMMYGVSRLLEEGHFPEGSTICCIHTGGLQGNRSREFFAFLQ